jgi:membrane protease YdiL (CAAX protease family)
MMDAPAPAPTVPATRRNLSWVGLIVLLVAFTMVPAFIDVLVVHGSGQYEFPDQDSVNDLMIVKAVGVAIVVLAISVLRWWPVVLHEQLRTRRWVWIVPIVLLVASVATIDYGRLGTAGIALGVGLLVGTLFIGVSEELLFRGVVLTFMRDRYREWIAATVTAVLFGAIHFLAGPVQIVASAIFGYLLYYVRRVSGGIAMPIVVHTAWDYAVFSAYTTDDPVVDDDTSLILFVLSVVLLLAVLVGHRAAEPRTPQAP